MIFDLFIASAHINMFSGSSPFEDKNPALVARLKPQFGSRGVGAPPPGPTTKLAVAMTTTQVNIREPTAPTLHLPTYLPILITHILNNS